MITKKRPLFLPLMPLINAPHSLLLTAPHNLGDLVAKVPFIRLFKKQFPSCRLVVMGRSYIKALVSLFDEIDEFIDFEVFFNRADQEIIESLRSLDIEVCIHLLGVSRQMGPPVLDFAQRAKIPMRIGNIDRSKWTLLKKRGMGLTHNLRCARILPGMHEFEWNLQPLQFFGIKALQQPIDWQPLLHCTLDQHDSPFVKKGQVNILIHPGSNGHTKEWPVSFYKQLIQKLAKKAHLILTGTESEKLRQPFSEVEHLCTDLRGKLDLMDLLKLIKCAEGLIVGSTGPVHLASLFNTPVCALYPKQADLCEKVWGPKSEKAMVLSVPRICLPCERRLTDFNDSLCTCMEGIAVDKVYQAIQPWLSYENTLR